ncbi:hypothetical protein CRG98_019026 [Punica granatum]|uniref:Reverse transcriptase domain-containing protein n=1 Tax=Punica granatum TaxID=22663 RepID=A0A2I0JXG6_PUNGR|nr:hypothetical protein CRG98_019026 [Punica granatum]
MHHGLLRPFMLTSGLKQVRGKLQLVINYQPLNHFLQDDKFPLPNKQTLFSSLSKAKVFSKFDLKVGFWQLGIHPEDRPETGFCIPNAHYQWKVMPFRLKTAPSMFHKAICRVFDPIMDQALVYIDDILLFSLSEKAHILLLRRFSKIVQDCGIMLFEKKMPSSLAPLEKMLKKDAPSWGTSQTKAIKELKAQLQSLPPLQIPYTGKRILQTNASDRYWGAVILEELNGKRHICGYRSGIFKSSEQHYHSTFKEIPAVMNGIKKSEFHPMGYKFLMEMDMSSFHKILQFKQKQLPPSTAQVGRMVL